MAEAIPVFLKNLFDLAAGRPDVVVIITLATRSDAFGKETDELTDALDAAAAADAREASRETQSVVARPTSGGSIVTPAADDEIAEILKRRLFSSIDAQAASQAGDAYEVLYQGLTAKGEHLAGGAEAPDPIRRAGPEQLPLPPRAHPRAGQADRHDPGLPRAASGAGPSGSAPGTGAMAAVLRTMPGRQLGDRTT
jgi:Protein of unknown function (DUF499)